MTNQTPAAQPAPRRAALAAAVIVVVTFVMAMLSPAEPSADDRASLARRYKFTRTELPVIPGVELKKVRAVHPSCKRIAAWVSSVGTGATLGDLDGDGLSNDLVYTEPRTEQVIVMPAPGTAPRYAPFALTTGGHDRPNVGTGGALVGDWNDDGLADVLVHFMGRGPLMFVRRAAGASLAAADFEPQEIAATAKDQRWFTTTAVQGDLDGDGRLDLILGNYFPDGSDTYNPNGTGVQELHNSHGWACNGGGLHFFLRQDPTPADPHPFREVRDLLPEKVARGWALGLAATDLDGDFLPDIYVANDLGRDRMLHNRSKPGQLQFAVVEGRGGLGTPGAFTVGNDTYHGMGVDLTDVNFDGTPDLFVSNVTSKYGVQETQMLWVSRPGAPSFAQGVAPYEQRSEEYGVSRSGWGWDAKFESFANQVVPDLVQATGMLKGKINRWPELQALAQANPTFLGNPHNWPGFGVGADISGNELPAFFTAGPDGRYANVAREVGFDQPMVSRGIATGDVDGDGRVDLAFANMWLPSAFYKNESTTAGRYVAFRLVLPSEGAAPFEVLPDRPAVKGRPAVGAMVTLTLPDGRRLTRYVDGGNGLSGRRSPELHFGLGPLDPGLRALAADVRWRQKDGAVRQKRVASVDLDRCHTIVLGQEVAQ
jgi:enediyne biosynthesis protein E4